tara:strand:- start:1319 stop:1741 length:423 start_codon:yes stop_codon:yes gene_type:complete
MKRNEFKLLLEDWKKNFIVENEENEIPVASDKEISQDYFDYFDRDESLKKPRLDDLKHPSHMHSSDDDPRELDLGPKDLEDPSYNSVPSNDSEEGIDGFSGIYDDPTYSAGDHSSLGQDDENAIDISDIENVNLFDLDEF